MWKLYSGIHTGDFEFGGTEGVGGVPPGFTFWSDLQPN